MTAEAINDMYNHIESYFEERELLIVEGTVEYEDEELSFATDYHSEHNLVKDMWIDFIRSYDTPVDESLFQDVYYYFKREHNQRI